jgi:uncharacterized protein YqhQ
MTEKSYYGGQAVIEGVMMRGLRSMAVGVRAPNGDIALYHEPIALKGWAARARPLPFVRGVFLLWDTMLLGMRALMFSANVGLSAEDDQESKVGSARSNRKTDTALWATVAVSILFSIGFFFVLPLAAVGFVDRYIASSVVSNLVEGGIRLGLLIGYMLFLGRIGDIRRVFGYHGAEHKAINAYEAGDPLDVAHVRRHSISHPRCGTGFLLVVVLLSILVFILLGRPPMFWRIVSRIVLVPVIAALAYEFIKWTAARYRNPIVRTLIAPSLALQRLTTRDPDDSMLEVAIVSLKRVLVADGKLGSSDVDRPGIVRVDQAGRALPSEEPAISEGVISAR